MVEAVSYAKKNQWNGLLLEAEKDTLKLRPFGVRGNEAERCFEAEGVVTVSSHLQRVVSSVWLEGMDEVAKRFGRRGKVRIYFDHYSPVRFEFAVAYGVTAEWTLNETAVTV